MKKISLLAKSIKIFFSLSKLKVVRVYLLYHFPNFGNFRGNNAETGPNPSHEFATFSKYHMAFYKTKKIVRFNQTTLYQIDQMY